MQNTLKIAAFTTLGLLLSATGSFAQQLSADPILIDIESNADAEPLLVAAVDPVDVPPRVAISGAREAVVAPQGFPAPSIILGTVPPGAEAQFGIVRLLPSTVAAVGFSYDDLDARTRMRAEAPDLFRQLLEEGHLDPPGTILSAALQTELQRMNCYRSRIDGDWGPGSRRSVRAYFDARGGDWPSDAASVELFREIVSSPDVTCVEAVAPTPPPRAQAPRPAAQPAPARTSRPAAQPQPQPQQPASRPVLNIGGGSGVFR